MTSCASSFESLLKTICSLNQWQFDPERDACSKLVGVCKTNGLFHPFYAATFEAIGTIRNKLSDAHGRGPKEIYIATKSHAEHFLRITASHMLFLHESHSEIN